MMASSETEPPPAHPSPKARRRTGALIAAFVALQFLIPLTYLTREDAGDERFTWRNLDAPTAPSCETSASLERFDGQREAITLHKLIHQDWVDYVGQGRRAVVDAFLRKQCEADGMSCRSSWSIVATMSAASVSTIFDAAASERTKP